VRKTYARVICGALAGSIASAVMTVIRMTARRQGLIEKTVPQAVEERLAARTGLGDGANPAVHHVIDHIMHVGYGAALGIAYGLRTRGRTRGVAARGLAYGAGVWLLGSWGLLPLMKAKQAPWRKSLGENAVDLLSHLAYGAATAVVAEELSAQSNRGPSSDAHRFASRIG
jgi:uncharacterized membrane protein YagU involved in acid resistance